MRTKYIVSTAQQQACAWLAAHNGSGVFDRRGCLLAGGERAPIQRGTWNRLSNLGHVTLPKAKGGRVELTISGREVAAMKPFDAKGYRAIDLEALA